MAFEERIDVQTELHEVRTSALKNFEEKGFPTNQENKSYFEERPYFDTLNRLKKVTVYEFQSDTFISYTDFYYWQGQFIKMRNDIAGSGKMKGIAYYKFKGEKLLDSASVLMKAISVDSVLRRANDYKIRFDKP